MLANLNTLLVVATISSTALVAASPLAFEEPSHIFKRQNQSSSSSEYGAVACGIYGSAVDTAAGKCCTSTAASSGVSPALNYTSQSASASIVCNTGTAYIDCVLASLPNACTFLVTPLGSATTNLSKGCAGINVFDPSFNVTSQCNSADGSVHAAGTKSSNAVPFKVSVGLGAILAAAAGILMV